MTHLLIAEQIIYTWSNLPIVFFYSIAGVRKSVCLEFTQVEGRRDVISVKVTANLDVTPPNPFKVQLRKGKHIMRTFSERDCNVPVEMIALDDEEPSPCRITLFVKETDELEVVTVDNSNNTPISQKAPEFDDQPCSSNAAHYRAADHLDDHEEPDSLRPVNPVDPSISGAHGGAPQEPRRRSKRQADRKSAEEQRSQKRAKEVKRVEEEPEGPSDPAQQPKAIVVDGRLTRLNNMLLNSLGDLMYSYIGAIEANSWGAGKFIVELRELSAGIRYLNCLIEFTSIPYGVPPCFRATFQLCARYEDQNKVVKFGGQFYAPNYVLGATNLEVSHTLIRMLETDRRNVKFHLQLIGKRFDVDSAGKLFNNNAKIQYFDRDGKSFTIKIDQTFLAKHSNIYNQYRPIERIYFQDDLSLFFSFIHFIHTTTLNYRNGAFLFAPPSIARVESLQAIARKYEVWWVKDLLNLMLEQKSVYEHHVEKVRAEGVGINGEFEMLEQLEDYESELEDSDG